MKLQSVNFVKPISVISLGTCLSINTKQVEESAIEYTPDSFMVSFRVKGNSYSVPVSNVSFIMHLAQPTPVKK
jgi:hypothetical protein